MLAAPPAWFGSAPAAGRHRRARPRPPRRSPCERPTPGIASLHLQWDQRMYGHAAGQHDTYGFALAAHPGQSQGRPPTNPSTQLIFRTGLPVPTSSRAPLSRMVAPYAPSSCPGAGSRRRLLSYRLPTCWSALSVRSDDGRR
jgi:hypothetical protein